MTKRHPGARRTIKDKSHDPDDLFLAKLLDMGEWAKANQQLVTIGMVVVVLLVAGVVYYGKYRAQLVQQAAEQLEVVHNSIALQDREGAKTELATFIQRFGGTPYEGEARLLLGELYLQTDDAEQAKVVLEPLGSAPREPIEFQAAALLAAAFEQDREWDEAETIYLRIADRAELNFQVRDALESAARIRADRGDTTGAIELYERVLGTLDENDPGRGTYEMRIQELRTGMSV